MHYRETVSKIIRHFDNMGSVRNRPVDGRLQTATKEEQSLYVLVSFVENSHETRRSATLQHDKHPTSVL